jgi:hypothetical protein
MDGFTGTELASGPFGETFAVAGRGGREVRFRRLASAFAGLDGFAELLLSHREPVLALGHPHLVTTVAVARDGKGRLIIAEGLPAGPSLDTCLELARRGDVHPSRGAALHVARALVSGLAHLHGAGLVHGMVHPRSVYIDPSGVCRLGDVAVAHAVAVAVERAPELRRIADDELAPADPSHPVDARLDVHRAGRLIQMLLGAAGGADAIGRLAEVIDRATAADPRERHADGAELLVHLDEVAGERGDPEAHREELARLVADTLAARPLEEVQATSAEHAEIAGEVELLADAEERRQARPAAPTVERPSVSDPDAGLIARARVLPRVPVLLVAAETAIALFLVIGFMRDPEPAPVPSPAPARTVDLAPAPPPAPAAATAPPARCVLNVRSSPLEATVVIDGLSAGTTPVSVVGVPCESSISVAVEKVGFESVRKTIQLAEGEPFHLQATLRRPKLMLRVASTPAGAQVAINGEPIGKTPLAIELDASTRAGVLLQMKGYRPYRATVVPSQQRELAAHLIPLRGVKGRAPAMSSAARPAKPRARSATQAHK